MNKIQAVNDLITIVGEPRRTTITSDDLPGIVQNAIRILDKESELFQGEGWGFNTFKRTLTRDINNEINVPANTLKVDPVDYTMEVHVRDGRLYDYENNTYEFDKDIECMLVLEEDFEDLPLPAQEYVVARAKKEFQMNEQGSQKLHQMIQQRENEAWVNFRRYNNANSDYNVLENPEIKYNLRRDI